MACDLLGGEAYPHSSDGNLAHAVDVRWHPDLYAAPLEVPHIKIIFYLDSQTADSGALRVIPGTNHWNETFAQNVRTSTVRDRPVEVYGVEPQDLPSFVIETEPGDVIVNSYRTLHASFNGGLRRRYFTIGYGAERPNLSVVNERALRQDE